MTIDKVIQSLSVVRDKLKPVLDSDAPHRIDEAVTLLRKVKSKKGGKRPEEWGYEIGWQAPLRFKFQTMKRYRYRPDLFCNIKWKEEAQPPYLQELVLRVWSDDAHIIYREEWDSVIVKRNIDSMPDRKSERVMSRYHFDRANPQQNGPHYHLQFGGNQRPEELCWFPKELDLPRLCHQPMDLLLACQLVMANFFPSDYQKVMRDPAWRGAVNESQRSILEKYYEDCLAAIKGNHGPITLLDRLWNNV